MDDVGDGADVFVDAEVRPLDGKFTRETGAMNTLREFGRLTAAQEKRHWSRDAVQRQVTGHLVTVLGGSNRGAFERNAGELLRIEEIGAAQMIVAFAIIGVDAVCLGFQLKRTIGGVLSIECELAGKVVKPPV